MDRTIATSFPDFTPTSGELARSAAATVGRQAARDPRRRAALLRRGRRPVGDAGQGPARVRGRQGHPGRAAGRPTAPTGSSAGSASPGSARVAVLLNTYNKAKELGWLLRHSDAQVLLTVDRHLGHDYLERLEQAVPGLRRPGARADPPRVASLPAVDLDVGRGPAALGRPGRRPRRVEAPSVTDGLLRECESEVTPADPMVVVYSSGSTADPKGAIHSHGAAVRHAHNLWQMRDLDRRRRALHADAAVLGRRLQLHADRGHARRRHPRVRGAVRAGRHPRPHRAGAGHPGARLAAHGQGARRPSDLQGPRPVRRSAAVPTPPSSRSTSRPTPRSREPTRSG